MANTEKDQSARSALMKELLQKHTIYSQEETATRIAIKTAL